MFGALSALALGGVVAWLVTVPMMLVLGTLGATAMWGGWCGGLVASPAWMATPPTTPEIAAAVRNGALASVAALLLGLVGSVLGGCWMASGEPMIHSDVAARSAARRDPAAVRAGHRALTGHARRGSAPDAHAPHAGPGSVPPGLVRIRRSRPRARWRRAMASAVVKHSWLRAGSAPLSCRSSPFKRCSSAS